METFSLSSFILKQVGMSIKTIKRANKYCSSQCIYETWVGVKFAQGEKIARRQNCTKILLHKLNFFFVIKFIYLLFFINLVFFYLFHFTITVTPNPSSVALNYFIFIYSFFLTFL